MGRTRSFLNSEAGALDPEVEQRIRTDLHELAVVWADLRVRLASKADLDEARRGPSYARPGGSLMRAESSAEPRTPQPLRPHWGSLSRLLGPDPRFGPPGSTMTWDGRTSVRNRFRRRPRSSGLASELEPQDFWSDFYEGRCAGLIWDSSKCPSAAFRTCIALSPKAAWCYHDRARAEEILGQVAASLQ